MARLDTADARRIGAAFQAFGLNFTDAMNAPAPEYDIPVDPDGEYACQPMAGLALTALTSDVPETLCQPLQSCMARAEYRCGGRLDSWIKARQQRSSWQPVQ